MFICCPKCGHSPLPNEQALPASCPACGVILAKVAHVLKDEADASGRVTDRRKFFSKTTELTGVFKPSIASYLLDGSERVDPMAFWPRVVLIAGFSLWGFFLITLDYRTGEIGSSFIHRPLLIFHEAGHVVFRLFGEWMMVLGGTLGQLIMPALLGAALLIKNRDPLGAAIGLWFVGVSLLDAAPYMYDALHPQLMLLSGMTGEEGGHDWIYLFSSLGLLQKSQFFGGLTHKLGSLTVILALGWGGLVLRLQHARMQAAHG